MSGQEFVIVFGLIVAQFIYGGNSVFMGRVLALGLDPLFLVIAGNLTNFSILAPFAVAFERKKWPERLSPGLMLRFVLIAMGGVTAFQALLLLGIEETSPAMASAMTNLAPGLIFIIAACLRFEKVDIRCSYSRTKIGGTVLCLTGAMAMSLLHSPPATSPTKLSSFVGGSSPATADGDWILGCIYLLSAVFILSCSMVLQAATMNEFPAPLSLCTISTLIGAVLTGAVQLFTEKKLDVGSPVMGVGTIACIVLLGGMATSMCNSFNMWCIKKRGPVFVSMFSPIGTVSSAILSALTLGQFLSMGRYD
uniref:WAT1-related protein n=1 Tax=Anthurium amnicola TaxID=1678845 RepID=A0A1D1Z3Y7_9ARAE